MSTVKPIMNPWKNFEVNYIDQAICESEQELSDGTEAVNAEKVFAYLEKKYYDKLKL